jgi:L-lactate dehydrogenase (cytochrome)
VGDGADAVSLSEYINTQFDPALSWRDVEWLRSIWKGPIVLKGIQTVEDARLAAEAGVAAIALSNHGGRQLDSAPAPLDLVPAVADAVGGRREIICDGGVRRGSDVVKAIALGARACMAGRAFLYGLGAAGESGVDHVYRYLASGMRRTMALIGCRTVSDLSRDYVTRSTRSRSKRALRPADRPGRRRAAEHGDPRSRGTPTPPGGRRRFAEICCRRSIREKR